MIANVADEIHSLQFEKTKFKPACTYTLHPLNDICSRTWVSQYQKGRVILNLMKQQMMGVAVASAGPYANICTSLQTDNHTSTSSLTFLWVRWSSWCQTNSVKALKAYLYSEQQNQQQVITSRHSQQVSSVSRSTIMLYYWTLLLLLITKHTKCRKYKHNTHTLLFNCLFSRTTRVCRHQKGKPSWILLKQEMMGGSGISGPYANHLHHISDR